MCNPKPLTWKLFLGGYLLSLLIAGILVWGLQQIFWTPAEKECKAQAALLQSAVNKWNKSHPQDQEGWMEFGFPGFVEQTLQPQGYLKAPLKDLRQNHSYYLQRDGFVNCRLHPRNPVSLQIMGLVILSLLLEVIVLGFLGYHINWKE
jgi:hypothetical protein